MTDHRTRRSRIYRWELDPRWGVSWGPNKGKKRKDSLEQNEATVGGANRFKPVTHLQK